ncbi:hypothetical protein WR25_22837 [Diploscapter pachys]|uniref:tRNA (adenine(58)-N(1))-methyltransferase catalytic subunit TRMT61A n=1 Tax=Diploscapter pachys TaxID=2018661 RepID=A0A2A2LGS8_9BILA|nr:hypothetical protein WR25_22837 [Diploscapter pachys]
MSIDNHSSSFAGKLKTESLDSNSSAAIDLYSPSFLKYNDVIEDGDTVMVYVSFNMIYAIVVKRGLTLSMKYGALRHDFIIGKRWGSRVSATAGFVYVLRPTADLWTRTLPRRTQILYTPDNAFILHLLDAKPGSVICESGTGSGSLSHAIAMCVAPNGHLYTHDIEESRTRKVEQEFKDHGLSDVTTAVVENVCVEGFFVSNACDGVFLDVPEPWRAIGHAKDAISRMRGGRLVSFSPCIEQVQRTAEAMASNGFVQITTVEIVPKTYKVIGKISQTLEEFDVDGDPFTNERNTKSNDENGETKALPTSIKAIPYPAQQPTHTGYLIHATMLPFVE